MSKEKKYIPLSVPCLDAKEMKYLKECIDTNWVSSAGKFVGKFEDLICKFTKAKNAIACINGTAGLFIALKLSGVGAGDEVIVPTLTFIAPVNCVNYLWADPVFMDCDDFMNLDPEKLREFCRRECVITKLGLKNKKSGRIIKAVIPVHIFGNPCDMEVIIKIAKEYKLKVIEDATESFGSYYTKGACKGRFTGTIGDFGVYSFNGNKIITTGGGGMIVTDNEKSAYRAKYLMNQAKDDAVSYIHNEVGYNFRLTNIQAALGVAQLSKLKRFIRNKKKNYGIYKKELKGVKGIKLLGVPEGTSPNYWFYSLIVEKDIFGLSNLELMRELNKKNIESRPLWQLNHLQRPFRHNQSYEIEKASWFWRNTLNVPCSIDLREEQVRRVVSIVKKSYKGN